MPNLTYIFEDLKAIKDAIAPVKDATGGAAAVAPLVAESPTLAIAQAAIQYACPIYHAFPDFFTSKTPLEQVGVQTGLPDDYKKMSWDSFCGNPPAPSLNVSPDVTFSGGQCDGVAYNVTYQYTFPDGFTNGVHGGTFYGPISSVQFGTSAFDGGQVFFINSRQAPTDPIKRFDLGGSKPGGHLDFKVSRLDGLPDNCGDPPKPVVPIVVPPANVLTQDIPVTINNSNNSSTTNNSPTTNNYNVHFDGFSSNPTNPSATDFKVSVGGSPVNVSLGLDGLTIGTEPIGSVNLSPVVTGQINQIATSLDNTHSTLDLKYSQVQIPICVCVNHEPVVSYTTVQCLVGTEAITLLEFQQLADIKAESCVCDCIAAVPEWWQIRLEGGIPQLIVLFGDATVGTTNPYGKWPITIPHYAGMPKPAISPIGPYTKGSCEGILTLKDNSKLIVNCVSEFECNRVIDMALPFIDQNFIGSTPIKLGVRNGQPIEIRAVAPRYGKFFAQGIRKTNPDWTVYWS